MSPDVERRLGGWNVALWLYAVVSLFALAGLLLAPGTLGHHWDWLIPSDPAELRRFGWTSGFAWQDFDFGSYVTYHYATTLTGFLFASPGFVGLGGAFVTKSLLVSSVFLSGVGMRFLLLALTQADRGERDGVYATFGGLLYALAPYAYNQILSGDQSALIADALSPIAIGLAIWAVFARDRMWMAYALAASILLAIVVASAQVFVFTVAIAWIICLLLRPSARTALRLAAMTGLGVALCAFWILPTFLAGDAVNTAVNTESVDRAFATLQQFSDPLLTLTTVAFPGDFYLHALGRGAPLFFAAYAALMLLCVAALIRRPSVLLAALTGIFALTAFLPLGGNPTVGPAILAIFRALLPYSLFLRTPQHLMFVVALVFPMMVYLAARAIPARLFGRALAASLVIFLAYGQGFFVHSNFFGLIGPFRETAGERATVESASSSGSEQYRTLYVPNAESYYYHPGVFDYHFESGDEPQVRFLPGITIGAGSKWTPYAGTQDILKALDELVPDGTDPQTQTMLLQLSGVKRIVVHDIGVPGSGVRIDRDNDRHYLERALGQSRIATFERSLDDRSLWRFDRPVPRTYAPDCVFGVPSRADPYDVLALASAAARCDRPATIESAPAGRSEQILPSAILQLRPDVGIGLGAPRANVKIEPTDGGNGFFAIIPGGVQDVEVLKLPPAPRGATGLSFRMYSSAWRRIWVQLYAPDSQNYYQTNVDFSGSVQDVAVNFSRFGTIGQPRLHEIRYLRFASRNPQLRDGEMSFSSFRWINRTQYSTNVPYLAVVRSRWDQFYFGGDRERVLFQAVSGQQPAYVRTRILRGGVYDVVARVQEGESALSLQISVDGRANPCSPDRGRHPVTERLVRLARLALRPGSHTFALRYCRIPPSSPTQDVGVQSLILATTRFAPPARRTTYMTRVVGQRPDTITLVTTGRFLIFSDSYDPRWSATQAGLPLTHVIANGYANGWLVPDPNAGEVIVSFKPQAAFELGIYVTLVLGFAALTAIAAVVLASRRAAAIRPPAGVESPSRG